MYFPVGMEQNETGRLLMCVPLDTVQIQAHCQESWAVL